MKVACFCGFWFTALETTKDICCPACGRRAHPPEVLITGWLRRALVEILDQMSLDDDPEEPGGEVDC